MDHGGNQWIENTKKQSPLHLSSLKGHVTCSKVRFELHDSQIPSMYVLQLMLDESSSGAAVVIELVVVVCIDWQYKCMNVVH